MPDEKSTPDDAIQALVVADSDPFAEMRALATLQMQQAQTAQSTTDSASTYLATLQSEKSRKTTVESFRRIARALRLEGTDAWRAIPWEMIDFAIASMIRDRLAVTPTLKPVTANLTISAMRNVLKIAAMLGRVPFEQYLRVKEVEFVKGKRLKKGRALTKAEVRVLFDFCAKKESIRGSLLRGLFAVTIGGGLRREEIVRLRLSQYRGGFLLPIGKGNKERRVTVDPWSAKELEQWIQVRQMLGLSHDFIFVSVRSDDRVRKAPLTVWSLWSLISTFADEFEKAHPEISNGTEKHSFAPHDLRRTFATRLLEKGMDLSSLQHEMGHASPSTTAIYDHRRSEAISAERRKINILELEERVERPVEPPASARASPTRTKFENRPFESLQNMKLPMNVSYYRKPSR